MDLKNLPDRFWAKVDKTSSPNNCWLWTAATTYGYGVFSVQRRMQRAHRVAYEALVGRIPDGLQIDHLCRVRECVNPEHLEAVTLRENVMRGANHVADQVKRTRCPQGHPYDEKNTYLRPNGKRDCRKCKRAADARYRAAVAA
ncbi:HNH endonuclease signature motif containing protein [Streptomyces anulatus]|uniref:HNH endonuclease signature motif containing protein n=1 Tax=Streptomyces anulatus TaxID=1892 RepID=UPI0033CBCAEA